MLKKWLILVIVLSCAIFTVSSGCSEKSNGNITKVTTSESGQAKNLTIESTNNSGGKTETKIVSTGNSDDWCRVGSSVSQENPNTHQMESMKITGIETVDEIPMCKAVYESNVNDNNYTRLEYLWSQDEKTIQSTAFDKSGNKISEFSIKNGTVRMVDKDGKETEFSTQNYT